VTRFEPNGGPWSVGDFRVTDDWLEQMADLLVAHGYLTYLPGNGTEYDMVLVHVGALEDVDGRWLLALTNFGTCMWLTGHDTWDPHPTYVSEKLGIGSSDAMAICNLLEKVPTVLARRRVQA